MGIEASAQAQFLDARADRRWLSEVASSDAALRQVLHGLPGVDQVGTEARAAGLATRSIKREAKLWALDMAVRMVDLTTLEGADTPGKVRAMCAKALRPDPADPAVPPVAAVCIYPDLVGVARAALSGSTGARSTGAGSTVAVASVATAFPSGRASLAVKLADVRDATRGPRRRGGHGHRPGRVPPAGTARSTRRCGRCARPAAPPISR